MGEAIEKQAVFLSSAVILDHAKMEKGIRLYLYSVFFAISLKKSWHFLQKKNVFFLKLVTMY